MLWPLLLALMVLEEELLLKLALLVLRGLLYPLARLSLWVSLKEFFADLDYPESSALLLSWMEQETSSTSLADIRE